jgi:hypothetical protein
VDTRVPFAAGVVLLVCLARPPVPAQVTGDVAQIEATGAARVFSGNVSTARQAALQSAYAEAMAKGAGADIGRLTSIRSVQAVSEIVASRSRGFVKSYELLTEQLIAGSPQRYEVQIRAAVVKSAHSTAEEIDGLKLFLAVIGSPKLLILLPERNASATPAEPEGVLRSAEAALATAFGKYGYPVSTSDDLVAGGRVSAAQLSRARQGVTADALAVARAAGADLLLTGVLRTQTQPIAQQGVEFTSATTEVSAKALVVSNGYLIDAFHNTITRSHVNALRAVSVTLDAVAADLAATLAWKIPSLLSAKPRVMMLTVENVSVGVAERLKRTLERLDGIDTVRLDAIPTTRTHLARFELQSSFVVLQQDELINHCIDTAGPVQLRSADKYGIALKLL